MSNGYVCKQCGGPSPIGIGYVSNDGGAYSRSAWRYSCDCGHSAKPLDCGHVSVPSGVTTGYATLADGKKVCFTCADESERERMRTVDGITAYLSPDSRSITTWTGGKLATVTRVWTSDRARKTYVHATDVHGARWYGQGPSESGTYVTLRRAKTS